MVKPHDASYKLLFSSPEMVRDLIVGFIPDEWLHQLDYTTLERVSGSYITDDLRERADDIIWRVRADDQWVYLYLLIEFQSRVDPWMAVRILTYVGLLYQDLIRRGEILSDYRLPPVLPIVLYNGERRWRAATNIADLIPKLPGRLSRYLPRLEYVLIDEKRYTPAHLAQLHNLVAAMMRVDRPESKQDLIGLVDLISEMLQDKPELRRTFATWIRSVLVRRSDYALVLPQVQDLEEIKMGLSERLDQWAEQYKQEGRQEGRQAGEALLLQRLLAKRFGPLPTNITHRISSANAADLEAWFDRLLDAETLDEVFAL
ncbi:Rpn family recombination-promoting nuclease/putative transposase [Castellaniella sp.]|uniref:Rpn family recombination-promoting nuclease/putative transposase n=1 Tax=Castellaniella sp. TaxID=1955812 RepID=UPI002AFFE2A2|nr:Rpn family recombination-promoting nuclease/putative transposase [Castellaniella sp.]